MSQDQFAVARVIEVARQQRQRQTKLRRLGPAHINHALGVNEIREVVVDEFSRRLKAAPFKLRVDSHREDILKAVIFTAEVIAIDRAVFWIDSAGPDHQLFRESVFGHIDPNFLRHRCGRDIVKLAIPIVGKDQQGAIKLFRLRISAARREGRIAVAVNSLSYFAVFNPGRAMPRLHDELVARLDVAKDDDFIINGVGDGDDFADGGHPAAHETVEHPSPIYRVA